VIASAREELHMGKTVATIGLVVGVLSAALFGAKLALTPVIEGGVQFDHVVVSEGATLEVRDGELELTSPSGTLGVESPVVGAIGTVLIVALFASTMLSSAFLLFAERRRAAAARKAAPST
jgi:hypothetical protein